MKRTPLKRTTPLGPGNRSRERGSTFANQNGPSVGSRDGKPTRVALKQGRGFAASPKQREKARTEPCVVTGDETLYGALVDPAHICARARGGCDSPLCVVPLRRDVHEAFDRGDFDLLPYLANNRVAELQHALGPGHYDGNLLGLLQRLTGVRWAPVGEER